MYSCTKHLPSIQNPFGSESLLLVVIPRQLYQYHKSAMLYPRSRTADNYPRQIRFYPRKPLGFGVILSTNYAISVFSYRQIRQDIGSVSADLAYKTNTRKPYHYMFSWCQANIVILR